MAITSNRAKAPGRGTGGGFGEGDRARTTKKASTSATWRRMKGQLGGFKRGKRRGAK